jgi:DNA ligase D-like protein (predicted ligase)
MMAENRAEIPSGDRYRFELKWDGIRAIIALEEGSLKIRSRNGHDITAQFPELMRPDDFRATTALFDGEIVVLDAEGRPVFEDVIKRIRTRHAGSIARLKQKHVAVCYLFDLLYLDGRSLINDPLYLRQEWLADALKEKSYYRISEPLDDGQDLWRAVTDAGLEGIVAKDRLSRYQPGQRSPAWQKIKTRSAASFAIVGWTAGQGNRENLPGSLALARRDSASGALQYAGRVGSGFSEAFLKELREILAREKTGPALFNHPDLKDTIWIEPRLVVDVSFAALTGDGLLRAPVFVRLRPDLELEDC